MKKFRLKFSDVPRLELIEMEFTHPLIQHKLKSIRGKAAGAFKGWGTFQWTRAVQALAIIAAKSALYSVRTSKTDNSHPILEGRDASHALSLDYAIQKRTNWLLDIFGCDSSGLALARRLFLINNSGKKRPGPVAVSLNHAFLPHDAIEIYLNEMRLTEYHELEGLVRKLSSSNVVDSVETMKDRNQTSTYLQDRSAA